MNDFKAMVAAAHVKGIRIIVDFVANHVHTDAPLYQSHKNDQDPWFHWDNGNIGQGYVCGWEKPIECWFAEYLPDFDYRNSDVMDRVMDHAIWLIQETNIDGFRLDAVKHMILTFRRPCEPESTKRSTLTMTFASTWLARRSLVKVMVKSRPSKTTSAPNFGWPVRLPDVLGGIGLAGQARTRA